MQYTAPLPPYSINLVTPPTSSPALLAFPAPVPTLPGLPAVPSPSRPAPPPACSAPHPSADSSARNSEPRGPETPSLGRAGPAAGKKRELSVPRTPALGRVRNTATPGGSRPAPSSPPPSTGYRSLGACRLAAPTPPSEGARALTSSRWAGPSRATVDCRRRVPEELSHARKPV